MLQNNSLRTKLHIVIWFLIFYWSHVVSKVYASSVASPKNVDNAAMVWSFGLGANQLSLKSNEDFELVGQSFNVAMGGGQIFERWFYLGSLEIILGPYQDEVDQGLSTDASGTGGSAWTGLSAQLHNIRSSEGSYGFALGATYSDLTGRLSSGQSVGDSSIEKYVHRVSTFSLSPAIFFSWLKPWRVKGNSPEQLMTRLEGYFLFLGITLPVTSFYKVKVTNNAPDISPSEEEVIIVEDPLQREEGELTRKGSLRGFSFFISFTSLLGV